MKNNTAKVLLTIAYAIWILGGLGTLIMASSVSSTFEGTILYELGKSLSTAIFISSSFSVFSTGMLFFGLAKIIILIEDKIVGTGQPASPSSTADLGASASDDALKF